MQTIDQLLIDVGSVLSKYGYYRKYETLSRGKYHIKFSLWIKKDLFVQVNRNEKASITNFALISKTDRIYGRDEYKGKWHRHPVNDPRCHNGNSSLSREIEGHPRSLSAGNRKSAGNFVDETF